MIHSKDKLIVRASKGLETERTPIWIMRQAGRYLPEYHQTKEKAGGFLQLCKNPQYAVEVAIQPIRRFGFDGSILFSDILIIAEAMGLEVSFNPGPIIGNPIKTKADVYRLIVPEPEEKTPFVTEILKGMKSELPQDVTLIGFAGAPFTVAGYMMTDKGNSGQIEAVRKAVYEAPDMLFLLIDKLVKATVKYLRAQIKAGAEVLQIFDSSASQLSPRMLEILAFEPARRIISELSDTSVPIIYFAPGAAASLSEMNNIGADVIGIDWRIGLDTARAVLGDKTAVQGNLDPAALLGCKETLKWETLRILKKNNGRPGHIFNLGHGIAPETPISNVEFLVELVKNGVAL